MALKVKTAKNSKLPKLSENYFEPVGKGGWPPISIWINDMPIYSLSFMLLPSVLLCWIPNIAFYIQDFLRYFWILLVDFLSSR
jgi:hypothetical protein